MTVMDDSEDLHTNLQICGLGVEDARRDEQLRFCGHLDLLEIQNYGASARRLVSSYSDESWLNRQDCLASLWPGLKLSIQTRGTRCGGIAGLRARNGIHDSRCVRGPDDLDRTSRVLTPALAKDEDTE